MTEFRMLPKPDPNTMRFYRFRDASYSDNPVAQEEILYLVRETPKGYWITDEWQINEKWVAKDGKKRYAYPSRDEAWASYVKRKEKQVKILTAQLTNARFRLEHTRKGCPKPITARADMSDEPIDF